MRLIDPGPGELLDRWTILVLKIDACKKKGMEPKVFEREKESIEDLMDVNARQVLELRDNLQAVNGMLWLAEDEVRATPELQAMKLAALAKRIPKLNDKRAEIIKAINELYGAETMEKLHDVQIGMRTDLAE